MQYYVTQDTELAAEFTASNYNFKELVRNVVHSDLYRQIH